jgi:hypothetical protein
MDIKFGAKNLLNFGNNMQTEKESFKEVEERLREEI